MKFKLPRRQYLKLAILSCLASILVAWLISNTLKLQAASSRPVDAFFVLGGSINREIYVARLAKKAPQVPILISQGSKDPCIWLIFQWINTPKEKVWLEKCAKNTFGNFYFSLPILQEWQVRKIKLITSPSHLPRAKWMAQIILGAHGIWVEPEIVKEDGVPGNREFWLKTSLDLTRSLMWAVISQAIEPQCNSVTRLVDVDLQAWEKSGFRCENKIKYLFKKKRRKST